MRDKPKGKIVFIRSNPVILDSRVTKEISYLSSHFQITILAWDRNREYPKRGLKNNCPIYHCRIKGFYGSGIKNLFGSIGWFFYEFFWLLFQEFDVVHACDFDTYLPALLAVKIKRKKIVYDIFDFYSEMILKVPKIIKKIIRAVDIFLMQFADCVIIADDNRKEQIKDANPKKLITVYNTPDDYFDTFGKNSMRKRFNNGFVLGYIGLLHKSRGLNTILELLKKLQDINLIIGGSGPYEETLKAKISELRNVHFLGKVFPYKKTLEILSKCDALFAIYDPKIPNHKYSSPNKLFEAMMLGKPIIVSKDTGMDEKVKRYQCGIVVDYNNRNEIISAIKKLKIMKDNNDNIYGINGRKAYENFFYYEKMQKKLMDCYYGLIS